MNCNRCNNKMNKNGTRNSRQRYKCRCGYEKEELLSSNILVIPDLHIPFEHEEALRFCSDLKKEFCCSTVIQLGDITDQYCFSRYARDPDSLSTRDEVASAQIKIGEWADEFPELHITKGNHCARLSKRLYEIGIPSDIVLNTLNNIFGMPDTWKWYNELKINNILYMHGHKAGELAHLNTAKGYRMSTVIGHSHSTLAVQYTQGHNDKIFGVNAGCLIDQNKYSFFYAKELMSRPMLGAVVMLDGITPLCIPME